MEKNIYGLLNEVETDFGEYEMKELSSGEKEAQKQKILKEVREMKHENRKGRAWKAASGIAAALAVAVGVTGMVNPALAKDLFSRVFGSLIEIAKEEKESGAYVLGEEETLVKIGEYALPIEEELAKRAGEEGYVTETEDKGVKISVTDVYCDGYILYYALMLETGDSALDGAEEILPWADAGVDGIDPFENNMGGTVGSFRKTEDGSYVLMNQIHMLSPQLISDPAYQAMDTLVATVDISGLTTDGVWAKAKETGKLQTVKESSLTGAWNLRFPVSVDRSYNETIPVDQTAADIHIRDIIRTRAGLLVEAQLPGISDEEYHDVSGEDGLERVCFWMNGGSYVAETAGWNEAAGGAFVNTMFLNEGQKDLTLHAEIPGRAGDTPDTVTEPVPLADFEIRLP